MTAEASEQSVVVCSVEQEWKELNDEWIEVWKEDISYLAREMGAINWDGSFDGTIPQTPFEVKWDGAPDYVFNNGVGLWAPTLEEYEKFYTWIQDKEFAEFDPYNNDTDDDDTTDSDDQSSQVNNNKDVEKTE